MKPADEISSTEKLLNHIQKSGDSRDDIPHSYSGKPEKKIENKNYLNRFLKKKDRIGIHFGYNDIRLVKIRSMSESSWRILDYRNEEFDVQVSGKSHELIAILKRVLNDFCGPPENSEIWCLM